MITAPDNKFKDLFIVWPFFDIPKAPHWQTNAVAPAFAGKTTRSSSKIIEKFVLRKYPTQAKNEIPWQVYQFVQKIVFELKGTHTLWGYVRTLIFITRLLNYSGFQVFP